jgi:hypothetical protein
VLLELLQKIDLVKRIWTLSFHDLGKSFMTSFCLFLLINIPNSCVLCSKDYVCYLCSWESHSMPKFDIILCMYSCMRKIT